MFFWICFIIAFLPLTIIFPIKKVGKKNIKILKGKNYIIACNHMSNLDPVMMDIKMCQKFRFLAKKELFSNWFNSLVLKGFGAIPVDRSKADVKAIKQVMRVIEKNKNVCIFPQGTRKTTRQIEDGSAKEGVAMFAIRTNTPVVPMMYSDKIRAFKRVKLIIGEPIFPDESKKKDKDYLVEFSNLITRKMNELLGENKNENERF